MPSRRIRPILGLCIASLVFAACGGGGEKDSPTPERAGVFAGLNDPKDKTIAVLAFMPQKIKIVTGAKLTWTIAGPEPHTVTFVGAGQPTPSPSDPAADAPIGTPGPYDGTATVSSGLQPTGKTPVKFSLTFPKAGTFDYLCVIHPTMTGSVEVVSGSAESLKTIAERARAERDGYLAEGRAAKKTYLETPAQSRKNADGSTTYTVQMGVSTAHTTILAFQPVKAEIKPGDSVVFLNDSGAPHTASFAGTKTLPASPSGPEARAAAPGKSPQPLNPTDYFNTGWLPPNAPPGQGPPEAARSFTFNVPAAGTYAYVCLLHAPSGMAGQIVAA